METIVKLKNISKAFSGISVLENINFDIREGSVHALIGGNGAGKSTLMKILSGLYQPDGGEIWVKEEKINFKSPNDAHANGIYLVPQEPMLYPYMSIEENILLSLPKNTIKNDIKVEIKDLMDSLECKFKLNQLAEELTIAKQQQVELIRGLIRNIEIIILDEPTSALTAKETDALFENINNLKNSKKLAFVYITHRLNELFEIANEITILKDGRIVSSGEINEYTQKEIIRIMVPDVSTKKHNVNINVKKVARPEQYNDNDYILEVENLSGRGFINADFKVGFSEIVGLTGVVGAGRTEVAETIFGLREKTSGTIKLHGEEISKMSPKETISKGIVYVPEDRHLHGGFLDASIRCNVSSAILYSLSNIFTDKKAESDIANNYIKTLNIKCSSLEQELAFLSGGNQQKVVLSKWLAAKPEIIILDEPTRGIDANAREEIYGVIRELAEEGIGVVVISSDFEEISVLSDRVIVMYNGQTIKEINHPNINLENITFASFGRIKEDE